MIEMSIENETALKGDGTSVLAQNPMARGRSSSPSLMLPVKIGGPFVVLAEVPDDPVSAEESALLKGSDKALQPSNGLQAQSGPQKLAKRRYSMNSSFKHPGGFSKRRRRANSECDPVLPSHFLLGGNIFDPLNLNSLMDEDVNRALNAETPKSSPLPAKNREPVEILIPRDITDPLNLSGRGGGHSGGVLVSPVKRRRHRYKHHGGNGAELEKSKEDGPLFPAQNVADADESPRPYELNTSINCRDEVVPPILPRRRSAPATTNSAPQPCNHRKRRRAVSRSDPLSITPTATRLHPDTGRSQTFHTPVVGGAAGSRPTSTCRHPRRDRPKPRRQFHHGTYSRSYGYRTPTPSVDPRLAALRPEWFRGKKVLDVGCSVGHVTLAIAKNWSPAHILGLDLDAGLVHAARQNLRHFLSELRGRDVKRGEEAESSQTALRTFPVSFRLCRGPVVAPPLLAANPKEFPNNVSFMKGNYVPESEQVVMSQQAEYDVILCLSVTKWVHLNGGDVGVQRLFRRVYKHLTPGGLFILQAQPWSSYSRRKRLTETTHRNYNSIRLRPDQFSSYLMSEVGFSSYELISTSRNCPKGLQRPIYLFHKGPASSRK